MKLNTLNIYATVSLLALSTALTGCTPPTADVSIRLTPESARNVRSGQYCASDLKAAFAKAFTDFQQQSDAYNGYLVENVSIPRANPETCKPLNPIASPETYKPLDPITSPEPYESSEPIENPEACEPEEPIENPEACEPEEPIESSETCAALDNVSMPGQMPWSLAPAVYDGTNKPIARKTFAAVTAATAAATGGSSESGAVPGDPVEAANNTISIRFTRDDILLVHRGIFCANDLSKAFDQAVVNFSTGGATVDLKLPQNPLQNCQAPSTSAQRLTL